MPTSPSIRVLKQQADRFGIRPLPLTVVLACAVLSGALAWSRSGALVASGVTLAPSVTLSTPTTAIITRVDVQVGQAVSAGQSLVSMDSRALRAELDVVDGQIGQIAHAAEVAQVELLRELVGARRTDVLKLFEAQRDTLAARAERALEHEVSLTTSGSLSEAESLAHAGMLEAAVVRERAEAAQVQAAKEKAASLTLRARASHLTALRGELDRPAEYERLLTATAELYNAQLDVLARKRQGLRAQLEALDLRALHDGIVAEVLPVGSTVMPGAVVVRVNPPFAHDVVAYMPPDSPPALSGQTPYVVALADGRECAGVARASMTGSVERKPEQLVGPMGFSAHGFPVRIPLGADCRLPIGQIVELRLSTP